MMTPSPKARFLISLLDYMINRSWYPPLLLIWFLIKDGMLHILGVLGVALVPCAGEVVTSRGYAYREIDNMKFCKTFNLDHMRMKSNLTCNPKAIRVL